MRRILACMVAAASLSSAASAADIIAKAPRLPPAPVFTWDGFYVGGHVGYLWGSTRVVENGVVTDPDAATNGWIGGLLAGVNRQFGNVVLGLESDFGWTHARGTGATAAPPPQTFELPNQYTVNWTWNLRVRAGYSVTPTTLLYVAGGLALTDFRFQQGETITVAAPPFGAVFTGWTVGGGIDQVMVPAFGGTGKLVGRIEYLYADYGNKTYTIADDIYNVGFRSQTVRGALILLFN